VADDIVTRLRDVTVLSWDGEQITDELAGEAADEIERLDREIIRRDGIILELRAEIARLEQVIRG
jgi:hypothetical protein